MNQCSSPEDLVKECLKNRNQEKKQLKKEGVICKIALPCFVASAVVSGVFKMAEVSISFGLTALSTLVYFLELKKEVKFLDQDIEEHKNRLKQYHSHEK